MSWYAVEALEDAIEGTREFLLPFDAGRWIRLAIIVFFLGGVSTSSPVQSGTRFSTGSPGSVPIVPGNPPIPVENLLALIAVLFVVGVVFALLFTLVGSVMEFAFVESLRTGEVRVRRYARTYLGQGLRLFGFRFVLYLVVVLPVAGLLFTTVPLLSGGSGTVAVGTLLFFAPVLLLLGLLVALVDGLTRSFVVPVMIVRKSGVLAGWRAFWPTLRREWKQYGVYLVLRFFVAIAVGVLVSFAAGILTVILLLPFAIVGVLVIVAFGGFGAVGAMLSNPVAVAAFGGLLVAYLVCLLFALALVRVPIRTYVGFFALLVLGDTNEEFDLIPMLREEIR